ncbi:hypothetical protein GGS20DRAFT_558734 [Poronia punctata]|nr:hypothetical protein GGS20DRAFT_558734 [Poronia punctata]
MTPITPLGNRFLPLRGGRHYPCLRVGPRRIASGSRVWLTLASPALLIGSPLWHFLAISLFEMFIATSTKVFVRGGREKDGRPEQASERAPCSGTSYLVCRKAREKTDQIARYSNSSIVASTHPSPLPRRRESYNTTAFPLATGPQPQNHPAQTQVSCPSQTTQSR